VLGDSAREGRVNGVFSGVRELLQCAEKKDDHRASKWQFSDGLYAEVLFWRASGPIARRRIVLTCLENS
jgi:hypothetical protein